MGWDQMKVLGRSRLPCVEALLIVVPLLPEVGQEKVGERESIGVSE